MSKDKKKKLTHIDVKDNGLIISSKIGNVLANQKLHLESQLLNELIKGANEKSIIRYKIIQNNNLRDFKIKVGKLTTQTKKVVKKALNNDKTINLTPSQVANISTVINKGLLLLQKDAINTYQNTLNDVFIKVKSANDLKDQLQKHIDYGLNLGVVYKDGKHYQFDTYYEMKARTDIQQDIGENLIDSGHEAGVVFYITSFYGDCAKDHADFQGKIYYDSNWKDNAPKDRIDEIENYIDSKGLKSVQEVMDAPAYLTTRPNCRHYFTAIDIDTVLGAKTNSDVSKLRAERNLNFNGKYKPEKYEALQKQRLNERKIRAEKRNIDNLEHQLALKPGDKEIQSQIKIGEAKVRDYQAEQRSLIKQYSNLERRYDRESLEQRIDFGIKK